MDRCEVYRRLDKSDGIYGYMYGVRLEKKDIGGIIFIEKKHLIKRDSALIHIWGWPGPDFSVYKFSDYGNTWAFSKDDFISDSDVAKQKVLEPKTHALDSKGGEKQ